MCSVLDDRGETDSFPEVLFSKKWILYAIGLNSVATLAGIKSRNF
jgi:hypothetical protein